MRKWFLRVRDTLRRAWMRLRARFVPDINWDRLRYERRKADLGLYAEDMNVE